MELLHSNVWNQYDHTPDGDAMHLTVEPYTLKCDSIPIRQVVLDKKVPINGAPETSEASFGEKEKWTL